MTALEPSSVMRDQAAPNFPCTWVQGVAESLPFGDDAFDGAILILCLHHFTDMRAAFCEIRRVVPTGPIVIFSYDPGAVDDPWLSNTFPVFRDQIRGSFPSLEAIAGCFGSGDSIRSTPFSLPHDLVDGFAGAAWRDPERYLDQEFRDGTSAFASWMNPYADKAWRHCNAISNPVPGICAMEQFDLSWNMIMAIRLSQSMG